MSAIAIPWGRLVFTGGDETLKEDFSGTFLSGMGHSFGRTETSKKDQKMFPYKKTLINRPFVSGTHFTIQQSNEEEKENAYYLRGM